MRKIVTSIVFGILIFYSFCCTLLIFIYNHNVPEVPAIKQDISETKMFELTNQYRVDNGLSVLEQNYALCGFSDERLEDIKTDWSHDGFHDLADSFYDEETHASMIGENLAKDFHSGQEELIFSSWVHSPTHKANLDNSDFTHLCIQCDDERCVQSFAVFK